MNDASKALVGRLSERFGPLLSVVPLDADASTRLFFRVGRLGGHSAVVMVDADGGARALARLQAAHETLTGAGLRLPAILDVDTELAAVVFEDLGDRLLATVPTPQRVALYDRAGEMAGNLEALSDEQISPTHPLATPSLNAERLRSELAFFVVHEIAGRRDLRDPVLLAEISAALDHFVATLDVDDRRLCHRDYHSRNLLATDDGCGAVDFQDALLAPRLYDLASLIYDPYVKCEPEQQRAALAGWNRSCAGDAVSLDEPRLLRVGVQRLLKAAGTFAHQATRLSRPRFLVSLTPALGRALQLLGRLEDSESRVLAETLGRACPDAIAAGGAR